MSDQVQSYRRYGRFVRIQLFLGGCLHDPTISRLYTTCVASLAIFTGGSAILVLLNFYYDYRTNLSMVIKCLGRAAIGVSIIMKVSFFLSYRDKLMRLHEILHDLFEQELARGEQIRRALLSRLNGFFVPACMYTVAVSSTIILFIRPAVVTIIKQVIRLQMPMRYGLPYEGKYPWTVPDNFLYHLHFLLEVVCLWFFLFTTCGFDESFGYYSFQMSSILRAVAFRLENPLPGDGIQRLLKTSARTHRRLLRCREYMEGIYGPSVFWMILTSTVLMCSLTHETVLISDFMLADILMSLCFTTVKIMQTLMYAWYGTAITSESENFRRGVFGSAWPDAADKRGVKSLVILTMMQEPMTIRAMKIFNMSVQMFVNVINTTISYFFLLQSLAK